MLSDDHERSQRLLLQLLKMRTGCVGNFILQLRTLLNLPGERLPAEGGIKVEESQQATRHNMQPPVPKVSASKVKYFLR